MRLLNFETSLQAALGLALLALDAPRMSVTDVACPIVIANLQRSLKCQKSMSVPT
jgi:hypothetical protein